MHVLTNAVLIMILAVLWVIASVLISAFWRDWKWFSRAGSVLAAAGGVLAARMLLRLGAAGVVDAQHTIDPTPAGAQATYQSALDVHASEIGLWFIILGTLIWGYGEFIGFFFRPAEPAKDPITRVS